MLSFCAVNFFILFPNLTLIMGNVLRHELWDQQLFLLISRSKCITIGNYFSLNEISYKSDLLFLFD